MMTVHQLLDGTNYIYILRDPDIDITAVIDPTHSEPVIEFLNKNNFGLDYILNTHHHDDHVDGNLELKSKYKAVVIAPEKEQSRIPGFDRGVRDGDDIQIGSSRAQVIENPGHTLGGVSFYFPQEGYLFSGDALFSYGCGRLFEGTPEMMMRSLRKLKALPDETKVFCGHEYAQKNLEFALHLVAMDDEIESTAKLSLRTELQSRLDETRRKAQTRESMGAPEYSAPTLLGDEKRLNPFLNTENLSEWTRRRQLRNTF